jgi:hypothetical protein
VRVRFGLLAAAALLSACASSQLNYNALDLADTIDELVSNQVLTNLARSIDHPYAVPSQVSILQGSASTTGTISANYSDPVSNAITTTNTVATAAAKTFTNTVTGLAGAQTLTPTVSDNWSQNWSLSPAVDADQMRRLRALYKYVTYPYKSEAEATEDLCRNYSAISISGDDKSGQPSTILDPMFLREPSCILCSLQVNDTKTPNADRICTSKKSRAKGAPRTRALSLYALGPALRKQSMQETKHHTLYINPNLERGWLRATTGSGETVTPHYTGDCRGRREQEQALGTKKGYTLSTVCKAAFYARLEHLFWTSH